MKHCIIIIFFFCSLSAFSQTRIVKTADGNYIQKAVEYSTADEYAKAKKYTATSATYTTLKGEKYPVYVTTKGNVVYVLKSKAGKWSARKIEVGE